MYFKRHFFFSAVNHEIDCRTRYSRSLYQKYTVRERALSTLLSFFAEIPVTASTEHSQLPFTISPKDH